MPDVLSTPKLKISCSHCGQRLDVTGLETGLEIACPSCAMKLTVPEPPREDDFVVVIAQPLPPVSDLAAQPKRKIVCSNCEQKLDVAGLDTGTAVRCPTCGATLTVPAPQPRKPVVKVKARLAAPLSHQPPRPRRTGRSIAAFTAFALVIFCAWSVWHWRVLIFGAPQQTAAPKPAAPTEPTPAELFAAANAQLAAGQYANAPGAFRALLPKLEDTPALDIAARCQIGAALYLLGKPGDARAAFEQIVPPTARHGFPNKVDADNFLSAVAQIVLGVVKPESAEIRFKDEFPPAWTLTQFYAGAQALGEGRFADAAKWLADYAQPRSHADAAWVLQCQPLAKSLTGELQAALNEVQQIARARAEDSSTDAAGKLAELKQRPFVRARLDAFEKEIARLAAVIAEEPALKEKKRLAKEREELERIQKLREQFAADTGLLPPAEQAAAAAAANYDFDTAAAAFGSAAGRMSTAELKRVAEERAALYRRLARLKQLAIETMPSAPYTKTGLANRRGGALTGKAVRADAQSIAFAQAHGEMAVAWRDLDPLSLLTLLTHYGDLAAASQPTERAANYVALAWLARDLRRDRETLAYAAAAGQLAADAKSAWERLTGPLPQPPLLPGEKPVMAEDAELARLKIPPFMKAGGLSQALANPNLPSLLDIVPKK